LIPLLYVFFAHVSLTHGLIKAPVFYWTQKTHRRAFVSVTMLDRSMSSPAEQSRILEVDLRASRLTNSSLSTHQGQYERLSPVPRQRKIHGKGIRDCRAAMFRFSFISIGVAFSQATFYPTDDHVFFAPLRLLIRPGCERVE
jgi:hypothetical protein